MPKAEAGVPKAEAGVPVGRAPKANVDCGAADKAWWSSVAAGVKNCGLS